MSPERKSLTIRVDPELHKQLVTAAGAAPLSPFVESLLRRALRAGPHPELPLRQPQEVQVVGLEKLADPIAELRELTLEVLRAVVEQNVYDRALDDALAGLPQHQPWWRRWLPSGQGREVSRKAIEMQARDVAVRHLARWQSNGVDHG